MSRQWRRWLSTMVAIGILAPIGNAAAAPNSVEAPGQQPDSVLLAQGINPHPVTLILPPPPPRWPNGGVGGQQLP